MNFGKRIESPLSTEAIEVVRQELAGPHVGSADGRFQYADDTPENREAQSAVYIPSEPLPGVSPDDLAAGIEPRYPKMVDKLKAGRQGAALEGIAESLSSKEKVVLNMNHASLIRSGIGYRAVARALEDWGVEFDTAAMVGIMLPHLKVGLDPEAPSKDKGYIPAMAATGLVSNHSIITIPNTERVKQSGLMNFKHEVSAHNRLGKKVFKELTKRQVGTLILIIGSGSHDDLTTDGNGNSSVVMKPVGQGTTSLIMENDLRVAQMALLDIPGHPFEMKLLEGAKPLAHPIEIDGRMRRTARFLTRKAAGVTFEYNGLNKA